jgi:hypothetical protein
MAHTPLAQAHATHATVCTSAQAAATAQPGLDAKLCKALLKGRCTLGIMWKSGHSPCDAGAGAVQRSLPHVAQTAHLLVPTLDCSASNRFRVSLPGGLTAAIRRDVYRTIFKVWPQQQQQQQQHKQGQQG